LPARQFEVLWLRYGEDCDIIDIACVLDTTRINVKVMLHRARRTLAKFLDADGGEAKQPNLAKAVLL
jgi:DNA-directed RNA polymerase specialized sigma24 family protein